MAQQTDAYIGKEEDLTFLELARLRFKRASEAEQAQRELILEAKKFRAGQQWPDAIRIQRQGGQAIQGKAAEPARPCLTIDRISAPVRQVSNTVRAANFAIDVHPNGFGADDETARILKGLLRQIQNDARGEDPIEWAADGAAEGGLGWFRLYADYCYDDPDGVPPESLFDQDLKLGRIRNSLAIYADPSAVLPTKADMRFAFEVEDLSKAEFRHKYGEDKLVTLDEFRSTGDQDGWVGDDVVRIANYWTCDYDEVKAYLAPDGQVTIATKRPEGFDKETWRERVIYQPRVQCRKITACDVLERWEWPGTRIPLFPILGEELNVDGRTVLRGVIASAMDPQRMVNYLYSGVVEQSALGSKSPYIVAAGQIDNYKHIWQNANTSNFAYLPYDPVSIAGTAVQEPHRESVEPPIQAMVQLLQISEEAIKATTSIYDPSLGNTNPREKSGRAIMALQQQADHANSNYVDNVQRAMVDCGTEMVRLCPIFYDRPGRVLKIAGIDDQPEQVVLGPPPQQMGMGGQVGMAAPAGMGQPNPAGGGAPLPPQSGAGGGIPAPGGQASQLAAGLNGFYDLSKGNYSVTVAVSKSFTTKREEGAAVMGDMISKNPQLLQIVGDLFFKALDTPFSQAISERFEKLLPPQIQQGKEGEPNVQAMQAQLGQAGQMVEMLSKELDAKNQIIQTDAVKAEYRLKEAQMEQAGKERIAWIQASAQLATAGMKVDAENARSFVDALEQKGAAALEAHMDRLENVQKHAHEAAMQAADHAHERQMASQDAALAMVGQAADQEHEAGMTASQQAHEATQADADRQATAEQSEADRQAAAKQTTE